MIVGAPIANYSGHQGNKIPEEPGAAYLCPVNVNRKKQQCVPYNITNPDDEFGFIDQVDLNTLTVKSHAWFGAAISLDASTGRLTVSCFISIIK